MSGTIPYPPELEPLVITDLEDIQIGKKIGEDQYMTVYQGILKVAALLEPKGALEPGNTPKDEIVTIKVLRSIVSHPTDEPWFVDEITTQAAYKHPCVLPLLAFSPVKSRPIIVTTLVSGETLADILKDVLVEKKKPLGWTNTHLACCLYGVATALRYLHERGCIHGDVKPANVLLGEPAPQPLLWGLGQENPDEILVGMSREIPLFRAPERDWDYDTKKVDVYSFGVMVYVMTAGVLALPLSNGKLVPAVGRKLCEGENARQVNTHQFLEHIERGGRFERTPAIDDTWWELITKCWDSDPEDRPSFEEICAEITDDPDKFAMAEDAESRQQFKQYVEDLNKKIMAVK